MKNTLSLSAPCLSLLFLFACGGDGKDGAPGATGPQGAPGAAGTAGAAGETGAAGAAGATGATGPKGDPAPVPDAGPAVPDSCLAIKTADAAAADGVYRVRLAGLDLDVLCNMTDGGWTLFETTRSGKAPVLSYAIITGTTTGRYMPETALSALASKSTQIRLADHLTPANYLESKAEMIPILRLRQLLRIQDDDTKANNADYWTANGTLLLTSLNYSCGTTSREGYPLIYWACGNSNGVHILPVDGTTRFDNNAGNRDIDLYVK